MNSSICAGFLDQPVACCSIFCSTSSALFRTVPAEPVSPICASCIFLSFTLTGVSSSSNDQIQCSYRVGKFPRGPGFSLVVIISVGMLFLTPKPEVEAFLLLPLRSRCICQRSLMIFSPFERSERMPKAPTVFTLISSLCQPFCLIGESCAVPLTKLSDRVCSPIWSWFKFTFFYKRPFGSKSLP